MVDPDFKPSITPYPDGPYYVNDVTRFANRRGPIRTRPTMVLCRCGASAMKPFCDGAHVKIGFSSVNASGSGVDERGNSALTDFADVPEQDVPEGEVAIFVMPDGPYVVTGRPELRNTIASESASTGRFALCRCGGSKNKPFCDGTHGRIGFKDEKN
ncbi:MAG TPA: CDGSH iron-sulfur domain-containing protein [Burkholderiales bacterium]|nr:CDGSH iron-sulfur domain-containing protein [Burkholderiales bacterium]